MVDTGYIVENNLIVHSACNNHPYIMCLQITDCYIRMYGKLVSDLYIHIIWSPVYENQYNLEFHTVVELRIRISLSVRK